MVRVFSYAINSIGSKGGGITDHIMEHLKPIAVPSVQPVIRTDQEEAVMILADAHDGVIGKTLLDPKVPNRQFPGSD